MLVEILSKSSGMSETELKHLAATASMRYKVYEVDKKTGGKRTIEHPSRELKAVQRWLLKTVFERFNVHQSATAYRQGSGIRENAERHRLSNYTNRYDFMNFFPSFKQSHIAEFVKAEGEKLGMELSDDDLKFIGDIVCRYGRLTIGAPSSPTITNTMMFQFDHQLFEHCSSEGLIYTRYADDIFISSFKPNLLTGLEEEIRRAKRNIAHLSIRINHRKTAYLSKKYVRRVAGVVITPDHKLSIGRDRKKEIKALIHKWLVKEISADQVHYMRGMLAFARDIEPAFEVNMRKKYGDFAINQVLKDPSLSEKFNPDYVDTSAIDDVPF